MPRTTKKPYDRTGRGSAPFEYVVISPGGSWDSSLPAAAARAGAVGLLDLTFCPYSVQKTVQEVERLRRLARRRYGLVLHARGGPLEHAALSAAGPADRILLLPEPGQDLGGVLRLCRAEATRVGLVVTTEAEADLAVDSGADFIVAKGNEAGGPVGPETTFVLIQRLLAWGKLPVLAWGGIGPETAAGCRAAGAAGVVLDWQFALMPESPVPAAFRQRLARMDGSETIALAGPGSSVYRAYSQPGLNGVSRLRALADASSGRDPAQRPPWVRAIEEGLAAAGVEDRLWPIGQDGALAAAFAADAPTTARALARLRSQVEESVRKAAESAVLRVDGPLATSHGTRFPIAQGPMTRVSDVPAFAEAVADAGALPFVALGVMRAEPAHDLLRRIREAIGSRPWGVGLLGFVDRALRAEQLSAIEETHPPYALIAGGRADQAAALEAKGIATYLHVPSPRMLDMFLREGVRRVVFEGRECGGHVGPRTSFVLWESMIRVLLRAELPPDEAARLHVLFAGGIHDATCAAMVAAIAQPLVERGMKVGVLVGTAYLFTTEAVSTGALVPAFQAVALGTDRTVLLETGPGHATRCADTEFCRQFREADAHLRADRRPPEEIRSELERLNLGRLRIAAKGVARGDASAGGPAYQRLSDDEQRRQGLYMMGQVAALRRATCTMRELHESICTGATEHLRSAAPEAAAAPAAPSGKPAPLDIAIVGMACMLPGAPDTETFWRNILDRRDAIEEIPADRFEAARWFDPDRAARDRICSRWGGFLHDVPFDPLKYGIPPTAMKSIEPMQLLALELTDRVLRDAGYADDNPHRARTGVVFGVGGGIAELGASYAVRAMLPQFLENPDETLLSQLPEWTEDSFAGILLNVVAGRVANRFNLGGVNYAVDAACASSLAAIHAACKELADGSADMIVAGGCDTAQTPLGYLCFSKTGALSPRGRSRTFDAQADGIAISEGLAAVVLKRRRDAERDGDRIYAVIRAVAGGSDGRSKGMTAPSLEGQLRTLERAYRQAGFSPATVGLFEAHGTGTPVGDAAECQALHQLLVKYGAAPRRSAIGSVKSMIGHTKCAAGVAGLIKAALALYHRVLPPTLHVESPNPRAGLIDGPLYVNSESRPWIHGSSPRRAGVSAFGFGGSNFHAVLEEVADEPVPHDDAPPGRPRPAELFVLAADNRADLAARARAMLDELTQAIASTPEVRLGDLAEAFHRRGPQTAAAERAALVAASADELRSQLTWLAAHLAGTNGDPSARPPGVYHTDCPLGTNAPLAFVFPGQGSQFPDMLRDLAIEFHEVADGFARADAALQPHLDPPLSARVFPPPAFTDEERKQAAEALKTTSITQPALGACATAMLRLLAEFGVRPGMAAGHSYGELVALHAAGCMSEETLYRLSWQRGEAIAGLTRGGNGGDLGGMIAVRADRNAVEPFLATSPQTWLANLNGPQQTVISGTASGLAGLTRKLEAAGIDATPVPVACAFHSPIMAPARETLARVLAEADLYAPQIPVYANVTADRYTRDPDQIRRCLADQLVSGVRFAELIEQMYAAGARIFLEAGPKNVLTRLVDGILGDRPHLALAMNVKERDDVANLLHVLGSLIAHGVAVDRERLYAGRAPAAPPRPRETVPAARSEHLWLVNGGYARPAGDPPRVARPRARMHPPAADPQAAPPAPAPAPAAAPPGPSDPALADMHAQFQETMRQFLLTQQAVMEAYLGSGAAAAPAGDGRDSFEYNQEASAGAPATAPDRPRTDRIETPSPPSPAPQAPPDIAPQPVPPAAPAGTAAGNLDELLLGIVSDRTGYPRDMLHLDANIEADLGIDSIKRVEIIGALRRAVLPGMQDPPAWYTEQMSAASTLRAISQGVRSLLEREAAAPSAIGPPPARVGPPQAAPVCCPAPRPPAADVALCPRCAAQIVEAPLKDPAAVRLPEGVLILAAGSESLFNPLAARIASLGGRSAMVRPEDIVSRESAAGAVGRLRQQHGRIGGIIHLLGLRPAPQFPPSPPPGRRAAAEFELKSLLFLLQAAAPELKAASAKAPFWFAAVTAGGGDFTPHSEHEARHPWRGGVAGLLKTAWREWPDTRFRAIDVDDWADGTWLPAELAADGPVEVGYRGNRRLVVEVAVEELPDPPPALPAVHLRSGSVALITGGARGITAQIAQELACRTRATLVLLGRSPLPPEAEEADTAGLQHAAELRWAIIERMRQEGANPSTAQVERALRSLQAAREIRATLAAIRAAGRRVEYIPCDVTDADALRTVVGDVSRRLGTIEAVIHGAGVIEDKALLDKTADSFDRVWRTKVDPVLTLADALDLKRLKLFMLFSSVAGFFGNAGQCDYAAANEALNRIARRLRRFVPGKVIAMNWGPWGGAGMVTPEVARQFEARKIGLVSVPAGRRAFWRELLHAGGGDVRVLHGPGPWVAPAVQASATTCRPAVRTPLLADQAVSRGAGGSIEAGVVLDPRMHAYLLDHCIDAKPVLPFTVALEMMAEVVAAQRPDWHVTHISGMKMFAGVIIERQRREITLRAEPIEQGPAHGEWRVRISDPETPARPLYEAMVRLSARRPAPQPAPALALIREADPVPAAEAYRRWLFHGPAMHVIEAIHGIGPAGIDARLRPACWRRCLGEQVEAAGWLIDPILLDACPQMALVWSRVHHDTSTLPNRLAAYHRFEPIGPQPVEAMMRVSPGTDGTSFKGDIWLVRDGRTVGYMEGLEGASSTALNRMGKGVLKP